MNINAPTPELYPQLKSLWQQAFGDTDAFIEGFFTEGFSPARCRCITADGQVVAALYWFDTLCEGGTFAYLYAVATKTSHRGQGLCRRLMEDTHDHLQNCGYRGALLVPAEPGLWHYYGTMGYRPFGVIRKFTAKAGTGAQMEEISATEYIKTRKTYLSHCPDESQAIQFYGTWGKFYRGADFLLAAARDEDVLYVQEFLGNREAAAGTVAALHCNRGVLRTPGGDEPCGMYLTFGDAPAPGYLGFPLD